jgi:hypothetical protein
MDGRQKKKSKKKKKKKNSKTQIENTKSQYGFVTFLLQALQLSLTEKKANENMR